MLALMRSVFSGRKIHFISVMAGSKLGLGAILAATYVPLLYLRPRISLQRFVGHHDASFKLCIVKVRHRLAFPV